MRKMWSAQRIRSVLVLAAVIVCAAAVPRADAASCESLVTLKLPNTTITLAQPVSAGAFTPTIAPGAPPPRVNFGDLRAFCRVTATIKPTSDSDIKIEVWLPSVGWNGRHEVVGNGGWAGSIGYAALSDALRDGYAAAGTDTGHEGGSAKFALGHPEKLIDNAYRAVHEMTVQAKVIVAAFYGDGPTFSYWNGCSSGGKQGLKEAQRFPADFDGIIAGAPANNMMRLHIGSLWNAAAVHATDASAIPPAMFPAIHKAVLDACDALDGAKDGLIEDPTRCHFDPQVLQCRADAGPPCLVPAQVEALRKIYGGAVNPRTNEQIFPGWARGFELGLGVTAGAQPESTPLDTFRYVVTQNPEWDWRTLDFDADVAKADAVDHGVITSVDPDLSAFFARGGKLLLYHGWGDPNISPLNTVNYYNSAVVKNGGVKATETKMRLFMMPGMGHCRGGEGPDTFDKMRVIRQWVEEGKVPGRIVATHRTGDAVDRTRPLCPYPQVAKYTGTGSIDDASNFACVAR